MVEMMIRMVEMKDELENGKSGPYLFCHQLRGLVAGILGALVFRDNSKVKHVRISTITIVPLVWFGW